MAHGLLPPAPPAPPARPFVAINDSVATDGSASHTDAACARIRVVTYNILADAYAPATSFPDTPEAHLAWESRQPRIIAELVAYGADILCLQEVQAQVWEESEDAASLIPALRKAGFDGCWFWAELPSDTSLKPRRKDKTPLVGPALLWKAGRFTDTRTHAIAFRDAWCAEVLTGGHEATATLLAGCRDGAVAALLDDAATGTRVLACSAHINWDYRTPDLKVLQAAALCDELARLAGAPPLPPLILGGDFNSPAIDPPTNVEPGAPSCAGQPAGAALLLSTGTCPPGHPHHPARQRGGPAVPLTTGEWGPLLSVRAAAGGEPALTTRRPTFEATLDYVFVSPSAWRVRAVMVDPWWGDGARAAGHPCPPAPPPDDFPPMPNADWPSDHLAVGADLELRTET
jgi:CCR4-NOT transcription complex subunit 6